MIWRNVILARSWECLSALERTLIYEGHRDEWIVMIITNTGMYMVSSAVVLETSFVMFVCVTAVYPITSLKLLFTSPERHS